MAACVSFTAQRDRCYHRSFASAGLRYSAVSLPDGTVVRCWAPRSPDSALPSLLLIHGFGANAMWQWAPYLAPMTAAGFNLYIPDLVFFGGSFSPQPDRSDSFQVFSPELFTPLRPFTELFRIFSFYVKFLEVFLGIWQSPIFIIYLLIFIAK